MELVGRDSEAGVIARAMDAVVAGQQRTLVVLGEVGIGKTALVDLAATRARDAGLQVLAGRAAEHERNVPFALATDALDDVVATMHPRRLATADPRLAVIFPSASAEEPQEWPEPQATLAYHRGLRSLLELLGRERPYVLLLDDVHWADDASLQWLLHLLRRPPRVAHATLLALRPSDAAAQLLDAARGSQGFSELSLQPLGREVSLALLPADLPAAVRGRIAADAAGNPLFLHELARLGADAAATALPPTVAAAVHRDLERLSPASRPLIEGAAVVGDPFDPDVAAAAAQLDPTDALTALDELVAADLIRPGTAPRTFVFRHPLIRRAVYAATRPGWRLRAHERAAAALERCGAGPLARAHHIEQCARPGDEAAIGILEQAAVSAAGSSSSIAARFYGAALRLVPHDDRLRRRRLLVAMAQAHAGAGQPEAARSALDEAAALLADDDGDRRCDVAARAALMDHLLGDYELAQRRLLAALDDASDAMRPFVALQLAVNAVLREDVDGTAAWAERAAASLSPRSPQLLCAGIEAIKATADMWRGDPAGTFLANAESRVRTVDDGQLDRYMEIGWCVARVLFETERYRAAADSLMRILRLARGGRHEHLLGHANVVLAQARLGMLELDAALEHAEAAEHAARMQEVQPQTALALTAQAMVLRERGDRAAAERAATASDAICGRLEPSVWTRTSHARNAVVRWGDDPDRLLRELERMPGFDGDTAGASITHLLICELAEAAIAVGRHDDARRWIDHVASRGENLGLPLTTARAGRARARLITPDEPLAAAEHALAAADRATRSSLHHEALALRLVAAGALLDAGSREGGISLLQEVAGTAEAAGAYATRDAAARELRRAGARVSLQAHRAARNGAGELTAREHEIAQLVADGRSNKEVARALFVSEKTVEHHLSRAYAKLGVRARTELAAVLRDSR